MVSITEDPMLTGVSHIVKTVDVSVPVSTAYNQWTQFESFPDFMKNVDSIKQIDDNHVRWSVHIGGAQREFEAEITEQIPDDRIAWQSLDGLAHAGVVTFHRLNDSETRVTVQIDWNPKGVVERIGAGLELDSNMVERDLKLFKSLIESNGLEEGAWRGAIKQDSSSDSLSGLTSEPVLKTSSEPSIIDVDSNLRNSSS